jgi:hypothetical protein
MAFWRLNDGIYISLNNFSNQKKSLKNLHTIVLTFIFVSIIKARASNWGDTP